MSSSPAPGRSWRGPLLRAAIVLIVGGILGGGAYSLWRHRARKAYLDALDRYRAAGAPQELLLMQASSSPAAKSGLDLYLRAFGVQPSEYHQGETDSRLAIEGNATFRKEDGEEPYSDEEWQECEALVHQFSDRLDLLVQAASAGPARYPLQYQNGWDMLMPHLRQILPAGNLQSWDLRCRLKRGETAGLWERMDARLALAETLAHERVLVSQYARLRLWESSLNNLDDLLRSVAPPEAVRTALEGRMNPDSLRNDLMAACQYELAISYIAVDRAVRSEKAGIGLEHLPKGFERWTFMPRLHRDAADCLDRLVRISAALELPLDRRIPALEAIQKESHRDPSPLSFLITDYAKAWRRYALVAANLALGAEAMRIRARVPDLKSAPASVEGLPRDPLFNRPIEYERTGIGFVLRVRAESEELQGIWEIPGPLEWRCITRPK